MRRRTFLTGLGAALTAPWVTPEAARATEGRARRLVIFFTPNGTVPRRWAPIPSNDGFGFDFAEDGALAPLRDHRRHLTVVDGLNFVGASNHEGGMAAMLTGRGDGSSVGGGRSVDQFVAQSWSPPTRFRSLQLGVHTSAWGSSTQTRMTYSGPGQLVSPQDDPSAVLRRLFPEADASGGADRMLARRQSVLDLLRAEAKELRSRLGAEERVKLDVHLQSLRMMETQLSGHDGIGADCSAPSLVELDPRNNDHFPQIGDAQMRLMVSALACDLTRVASLQWSHTVSPIVFSWLGLSEGHHGLSHMDDRNTQGVNDFIRAEQWFAERFAELLDLLQAIPEPGAAGSMLDHSLVVWAKEMGDSRLHVCDDVPFVLAGGAGGHLSPGRWVQAQGQSHEKLLVSICRAAGLDVNGYGAGSASGELEGVRG